MKIVILILQLVRGLLWLCLLPWLLLVACLLVGGLKSASSAIQEAAVCALVCALAFMGYATVRALHEIIESVNDFLFVKSERDQER